MSAAADGEASTAERRELEAHLAECVACTRLASMITDLDRRVRFRPAEPVPDLVARIAARTRPAVLGRGGWLRPALAWVAVVIFAQNVAALVFGEMSGAETHLARHLGAFGAALAIGFAYVAWKPHRAAGMLPFVAALIATTLVSAVADVVDGGRAAVTESTHVAEIVGLVLLWMIAGSPGWHGRRRRRPRPVRHEDLPVGITDR